MATFSTKFFDSHTREEITDPQDLDAHDSYSVSVCDEDGTRVSFAAPGQAETAHCQRGHRWQEAFTAPGQFGGWIALRDVA